MPTNALSPGAIQFFDNFIPQLHDGTYTITATQTLDGVPGAPPSFSRTRRFLVSGPRFQIDPAEIHSQFPPPNHSGQFETHLPHIVLKKRGLPWERFLDKTNADEKAPWMALLLFNAGTGAVANIQISTDGKVTLTVANGGSGYEIAPAVTIAGGGTGATALATIGANGQVTGFVMTNQGSGYSAATPPKVTIGSPTQAITTTVQQVLAPGVDAGGKPILAPVLTLDTHEDPTAPCRAIDVSTTAFAACAPRYVAGTTDELACLAHGRQVNTGDKEPLGLQNADGSFAVLLAKRFPRPLGTAPNQTPNRQIAHLVSLEGYASLLDGSPDFGTSQLVRLVSLASWTFTCQPAKGESFSDLMNDLVQTENGTNYLLKLPYGAPAVPGATPAALAQATGVLDLGYVPMGYQTQQGEYTFAWYRGPLSPVVPPPYPDNPQVSSAPQAMIYDPAWGVFNQSLSVAWQTGRLLALSDKTFAVSLMTWRREGHQLVNLLADRLPARDPALLTTLSVSSARQLLQPNLRSQRFMGQLLNNFGKRVAPKLAQPGRARSPEGKLFKSAATRRAEDDDRTVANLKAVLTNPGLHPLLQELGGFDASANAVTNDRAQQISDWLAALVLLYGVPFKNLVPVSGMLPKGSIRFFYLDQNVLTAMVDGAMSVGIQTERDALHYTIMRSAVQRSAQRLMHEVRPELLGQPVHAGAAAAAAAAGGVVSGFLLRSAVVSGWPGLEIKGFADAATATVQISAGGQISLAVNHPGSAYDPAHPPAVSIFGGTPGRDAAATAVVNAQGQVTGFTMTNAGSGYVAANPPSVRVEPSGPIPLLRMDRLSAEVMICLFPTVPRWIQIDEPREGLAFGVEDPVRGASSADNPVYLRHVLGASVGEQFGTGGDDFVDATPFIAANGVVDMLGLKQAMEANALLQPELKQKTYQPGLLSPADFALQMVRLPERMIFSF
jgi:hypothetical protein